MLSSGFLPVGGIDLVTTETCVLVPVGGRWPGGGTGRSGGNGVSSGGNSLCMGFGPVGTWRAHAAEESSINGRRTRSAAAALLCTAMA